MTSVDVVRNIAESNQVVHVGCYELSRCQTSTSRPARQRGLVHAVGTAVGCCHIEERVGRNLLKEVVIVEDGLASVMDQGD